MKIAVTVTSCHQIGIETWLDDHITKTFDEKSTIGEIDTWIKSVDKSASFSNVKISLCVE